MAGTGIHIKKTIRFGDKQPNYMKFKDLQVDQF